MSLKTRVRLRTLNEELSNSKEQRNRYLRTEFQDEQTWRLNSYEQLNTNSINFTQHLHKNSGEQIDRRNIYRMLRLKKHSNWQNAKMMIDPTSKIFKVMSQSPTHLLCLKPEQQKSLKKPMKIHTKLLPFINERQHNYSVNHCRNQRQTLLGFSQQRIRLSPNKKFEEVLQKYSEELKRKKSSDSLLVDEEIIKLIKSSKKLQTSTRKNHLNQDNVNEHLNIIKVSLLQSPKGERKVYKKFKMPQKLK